MNLLCESKGFRAGLVLVPAFELSRGEWLLLRWPVNSGSDSEESFYAALSGIAVFPGLIIHVTARIVALFGRWAKPPYHYSTVGELMSALPAEDKGRFRVEIDARQLAADAPLDQLPATPKLLAGLGLASLSGGLFVFNTAGLDPIGVQKAHASVAEKIRRGLSVIELEFHGGTGEEEFRLPGVKVLEASL
jgi:hypothetical protein